MVVVVVNTTGAAGVVVVTTGGFLLRLLEENAAPVVPAQHTTQQITPTQMKMGRIQTKTLATISPTISPTPETK